MIFNANFEEEEIFFEGPKLDIFFKIKKFFLRGGTIRQGAQKYRIWYFILLILIKKFKNNN